MGTQRHRRAALSCLAALLVLSCGGKGGEGTNPGECTDGIDNDDNGLVDCRDSGCLGSPDCAEDSGDPGTTSTTDPGPELPELDASWPDQLTWITVEPGTFTMGAEPEVETEAPDEYRREITHTYAFEVATTEVTVGLFNAVMDTRPDAGGCGEDTCPATGVSWHEAAAFTVRLSEAAGLEACYTCSGIGVDPYCLNSGRPHWCEGYRLPTEAEWERSARGGLPGAYAGGPDPELLGWIYSNADGRAHPVGQLEANAWGAYDFTGNAWEWCHDLWGEIPDPDERVDPFGPEFGSDRTLRGGGFETVAADARVANREPATADFTGQSTGFRLVRTLEPSSAE